MGTINVARYHDHITIRVPGSTDDVHSKVRRGSSTSRRQLIAIHYQLEYIDVLFFVDLEGRSTRQAPQEPCLLRWRRVFNDINRYTGWASYKGIS